MSTRIHGGPDAQGAPRWDFSTNANACGPAPDALAAVRAADRTRYPDPAHSALREALAERHGCAPERIVIAASASEFIVRITTWLARHQPGAAVHAPEPGYRDYAHAAHAQGLALAASAGDAQLVWHTEPGSPLGDANAPPTVREGALLVIDRAYAPLRLEGRPPELPASAWQLWSPNKALGLTGVRAAYAVAPAGAQAMCRELDALAPSWPIGADGVAMLHAWCSEATTRWLREGLVILAQWKREQLVLCAGLGWHCEPSVTPFYVARWPRATFLQLDAHLRELGIKLRDTTSLGLPGHVRLSVQPPAAQRALALALAWRAAAQALP
jgi:histidinol-phosphate aminotransferase